MTIMPAQPLPSVPPSPSASGQPNGAEEAPKKRSKKKFVVFALVILLLGGGVYFIKGRSHTVIYKPGQSVPAGKILSFGSFTLDTSDGQLVQLGISLQLTKPAKTKTVTEDKAQLANATIADVDNFTYAQLLTPAGRAQLQRQLLHSYQQILGVVDGAAPQVSAVYFTSFVLQ